MRFRRTSASECPRLHVKRVVAREVYLAQAFAFLKRPFLPFQKIFPTILAIEVGERPELCRVVSTQQSVGLELFVEGCHRCCAFFGSPGLSTSVCGVHKSFDQRDADNTTQLLDEIKNLTETLKILNN